MMNMKFKWVALIAAACACLEWTRLTGIVKGINLKDSILTLENREGDLLAVPVDWQVQIREKDKDTYVASLKDLKLNEKVTLTRIVSDKPLPAAEDTGAMTVPK